MSKLVKVAETKEVAPGTGKVVAAEGHSLALFNVSGTFYVIDNTCTHMGGPHQHVFWLQVAMKHALVVGVCRQAGSSLRIR